jgi:hypothetical protein
MVRAEGGDSMDEIQRVTPDEGRSMKTEELRDEFE